jgi:hypothetical protein
MKWLFGLIYIFSIYANGGDLIEAASPRESPVGSGIVRINDKAEAKSFVKTISISDFPKSSGYATNHFAIFGINITQCQQLCNQNPQCLMIFYIDSMPIHRCYWDNYPFISGCKRINYI